jgi:hypothetical protein
VLALIVTILLGWLILKLLWPREPIYIEPPPPQVVIHVHLIVPVKERTGGDPCREKAFVSQRAL